jgi:hypothetical protein
MKELIHEALSGGNYWVKRAPAVVVVATKLEFGCRLSDRRDDALLNEKHRELEHSPRNRKSE